MKKLSFEEILRNCLHNIFKADKHLWYLSIILAFIGSVYELSDFLDGFISNNESKSGLSNLFSSFADKDMVVFFVLLCIFIVVFSLVCIMFLIIKAIVFYYMFYYGYENVIGSKPEGKANIKKVIYTNIIVYFKILIGLFLFIVPGIIIYYKYTPLNYVLCKYPNLSLEDTLDKTVKISKNFKGKIFIYDILLGLIFVFVFAPLGFIFEMLYELTNSCFISVLILAYNTFTACMSYVITIRFTILLFKEIEKTKNIIPEIKIEEIN